MYFILVLPNFFLKPFGIECLSYFLVNFLHTLPPPHFDSKVYPLIYFSHISIASFCYTPDLLVFYLMVYGSDRVTYYLFGPKLRLVSFSAIFSVFCQHFVVSNWLFTANHHNRRRVWQMRVPYDVSSTLQHFNDFIHQPDITTLSEM